VRRPEKERNYEHRFLPLKVEVAERPKIHRHETMFGIGRLFCLRVTRSLSETN
jgi:hypothetical protein